MKIEWKKFGEDYDASLNEGFDKKSAVKQLMIKILDLSKNKDNWNSLVLDKWIFSLGRLIGHIQNLDEEIGMDRGYRVEIQFMEYYNKLENSKDDDEYANNLYEISKEIEDIIKDVLHDKDFKLELVSYYENNSFSIEISEQGQRIGFLHKLIK